MDINKSSQVSNYFPFFKGCVALYAILNAMGIKADDIEPKSCKQGDALFAGFKCQNIFEKILIGELNKRIKLLFYQCLSALACVPLQN